MEKKVPDWIRGNEARLQTEIFNKLLKDNRIKQKEMADLLGVSEGQISKLCSGENNLTLDKMVVLHYELGLDLNYFIARDEKCHLFMDDVENDRIKRFDYLLENMLIEVENAPKREHNRMVARAYKAFGEALGIKIDE